MAIWKILAQYHTSSVNNGIYSILKSTDTLLYKIYMLTQKKSESSTFTLISLNLFQRVLQLFYILLTGPAHTHAYLDILLFPVEFETQKSLENLKK